MNTNIYNALVLTALSFPVLAKHYEEINSKAKYDQVLKGTQPHVIAFYQKSCGACTKMDPGYDEMAEKFKGKAEFYVLDTEKNKKDLGSLIKEHKIEGIPTTLFLKQGKEVHRERGCMTKEEIEVALNQFLNGPSGFIVEKQEPQATQKVAQK